MYMDKNGEPIEYVTTRVMVLRIADRALNDEYLEDLEDALYRWELDHYLPESWPLHLASILLEIVNDSPALLTILAGAVEIDMSNILIVR